MLEQSHQARTRGQARPGSCQSLSYWLVTPRNSLIQKSLETWKRERNWSWSWDCYRSWYVMGRSSRSWRVMWTGSRTMERIGFQCLGLWLELWGLFGSSRGFLVDFDGFGVDVDWFVAVECLRLRLVLMELDGSFLCKCAFLCKWFRKLLGLHRIFALAWLPNSPGRFDACTYNSLCKIETIRSFTKKELEGKEGK